MERRTAARMGWSVWAVSVVLAGAGLTLVVLNHREAELIESSLFFTIFLAMATVGALAVSRQHANATGWIFLAIGLCAAVAFTGDEYATFALVTRSGSIPGGVWAFLITGMMWIGLLSLPFVFLPLLFPDGRLPSPRWRRFAWLAGAFVCFVAVVFTLDPANVGPTHEPNPVGVEALRGVARFLDGPGYFGLLILGLISLGSLVFRFRRATGIERQQIKWFAFGAALLTFSFLADAIAGLLGVRGGLLLDTILPAIGFMAVPVGAGIAMLRYRLYDIDVVINRTVLFGLLVAFITIVYVGIVVGIGALVGGRNNVFLSIVATAIIAVAFQPIRTRARHVANRLVYGKRATPYEVLSEFSDRMAGSFSTEDVLPRIARVIAEGTGAARAEVWLRVGDQIRPAAAWPDGAWPEKASLAGLGLLGDDLPPIPGADRAYPVRHQGELLGALTVAKRPNQPITPAEEKLLQDLAAQAGLILRNARLTEELKANLEELRASRQRIVTAQDEERRRLERNIHDGAQQQLVALAVKLRLARTLTGKDPGRAATMLDDLQSETQDALENLRDLARGIYPPLLADKGLGAALQAQARKVPLPVNVDANGIGRYSQDAEAAAYFCVLEALQNIAKYAGASQAIVRLGEMDGELTFSVSDDGEGFDVQETTKGSGLQNMADRVEALGGTLEVRSRRGEGTTVAGKIPGAAVGVAR